MANRAEALVNEVEQLVTLPAIYLEIRRVIEAPDSGIIDAAKVISMDVALTARLLRIVNSPAFGQSRPVETVTRAVSLLGMNQIHDLSLAACLASTFTRIKPEMMDVARYWRDCLTRAVAARELARQCGILNRERLFILGLLCDIGHMVMYMRIPEAAAKLFTLRHTSPEAMHEIERRNLECDYAQVGAALLRRWRLPDSIIQPIERHTEPDASLPHAVESALLNLVEGGLRARADGLDIERMVHPNAWSISGLTPESVTQAIAESETQGSAMTGLFQEQRAA
jgi:HD-like signal output (HDOD) protein